MPDRPKIGAQIRRARQLLDMRQQDLAEKVGVSRTTVDSWEHDHSWPQRKLAKLEQVLGVTLDSSQGQPEPDERERWERWVADHPDIPDHIKEAFIRGSRSSRSPGTSPARSRGKGPREDPGRQAV